MELDVTIDDVSVPADVAGVSFGGLDFVDNRGAKGARGCGKLLITCCRKGAFWWMPDAF